MAQGRFRDDLTDVDLAAQVIWSAMHGVVSLEIAKCKDEWVEWRPVEERAQAVIDMIIHGLLKELIMAVDLATKSLLHDKLRFFITVSGVAFAVTLVFVQVGLFIGLMDNASLTIDQIDADLWVTSHNTPNVDFAHTFPETYIKRVRSIAGRGARGQPDRLVHEREPAHRRGRRHRGVCAGELRALELPAERRRRQSRRSPPRPVHGARRLGEEALGRVRGRTTTAKCSAAG